MEPSTIRWIDEYLSYRSQYVTIGGENSEMKSINTGIPQGSVLGPVMYSIYVNELSEVICDKENCREPIHQNINELFGDSCDKCGNVTNYADDSTVHIASKHRDTVQSLLRQKLDKLKEFLTANRLTINVSKTLIMEILLKQKRSKLKGNPPPHSTNQY